MASPIPIWWDVSANASTLTWSCGTVDAGSYSSEKEFYVWNNKGGASDVSDMTSVFITTKDTTGNDAGPVAGSSGTVADVEVTVYDARTSAWTTWKAIRGSDAANHQSVFYASSLTTFPSGHSRSGETVTQDTIYGTANDGLNTTANSKFNFSDIKLRLHVLEGAPAGSMAWKTRISYQYT
jgi:hypothetical protein